MIWVWLNAMALCVNLMAVAINLRNYKVYRGTELHTMVPLLMLVFSFATAGFCARMMVLRYLELP